MKNKRSNRRLQIWAFSRHFWMHRRENLFVLVILTMGFLFYTIYGTWIATTSSPEGLDVEPLRLPAEVAAQVPYWVTGLEVPSPRTVFESAYLSQETFARWRKSQGTFPAVFETPVDEVVEVLEVPVLGSCGMVSAWGLRESSNRLSSALPLVAGRWPVKTGELAIHVSCATAAGQGMGGELTLQYIPMPDNRAATLTGQVVGIFEGDYDVMPEIVVVASDLEELTNINAPNLFLAWSRGVPDRVMQRPWPYSTAAVYRTPPLSELVGTGLAPIRMPAMLRYEPVGAYFPFGMTINDRVRVDGGVEQGLRPLFEGLAARVWPLTLLIFLSQGIALTVVLAIVVVDRQHTLGIYKVLGVDKGQLRQLYFLQVLMVGLFATALGSGIFFALRPLFFAHLGLALLIHPGTMVLWLLAVLLFATWAGHVAASLFASTEIDSLLKVTFNLDWWSIVRLDLVGARASEGVSRRAQNDEELEIVFVDELTDGVLDPQAEMLGPVGLGGLIVADTAAGRWGSMIHATRSGYQVTRPVAVEGAEVGDAIVIRIKDITVSSLAATFGTGSAIEGRFLGAPFVAVKCPECGMLCPETNVEVVGIQGIRCTNCGAEMTAFQVANGHAVGFDARSRLGVTLGRNNAERLTVGAARYTALPDCSAQDPILNVAPADLVGMVVRLRPFLGQIGTTPALPWPDTHNAGDFGTFLVRAPHEYGIDEEQLALRTDGHLDCDAVRAGAILICPVKTPGGGVYIGDMHALQGDGEIAGHTMDIAGTVTLQVDLIKGLTLDGPILLPNEEDLPFPAKPLSQAELKGAQALARQWGLDVVEETAPISVIGTGAKPNEARDNGLERAARLLGVGVAEIRNRVTVTGAIEIARHPGVVQVTFRAPLKILERIGLGDLVREQYG